MPRNAPEALQSQLAREQDAARSAPQSDDMFRRNAAPADEKSATVDRLAINGAADGRQLRDMQSERGLAAAAGRPGEPASNGERKQEAASKLQPGQGGAVGGGAGTGGPDDPKKEPAPVKVQTWQRAAATPNASRLMIGDQEELQLKGMQVNVRVEGFRARVLLDFQFYNDRAQQFEGTFKLRLPDEASPYFFAFGETKYQSPDAPKDRPVFFRLEESRNQGTTPEQIMEVRKNSWEHPKEARMVPRDTASQAYLATVRRRVDPALMEWSGAGIFSARVFPIAAGKMHRIVIGYDVDLLSVGSDLEYRLDLPEIQDCVVDLSVATPGSITPEISPKSEAVQVGNRTYYHFPNPESRSLVLRLPSAGPIALSGHDPKTTDYFAVRFRPELPAQEVAAQTNPQAVFLVDVSMSANPERFNVWLKLLEEVLSNNRGSLQRFSVLFFNIEAFWWREQFVENTPENVAALLKDAKKLALEGATDLSVALGAASRPAWSQADLKECDFFLLSDGAATWGESDLHALSQLWRNNHGGPLFSYTTGFSGTDSRTLQHLARESGGAVFAVVGEAEVKQASQAHRQRPWQLVDVQLPGGSDLLLAGRPQTLFPGQNLLLVGRGAIADGAEIQLKLKRGTQEQTVATKLAANVTTDLAPRIYGQVATGQLEDLQSTTEELSRAYACHFRVTGQTCSLLMLETEEDYLRFNIRPQEDAFVVQGSPAAAKIAETLTAIGRTLGDPKVAFLNWLKQMEKLPNANFEVPTAFRLALEKMPTESFAVVAPQLRCQMRSKDDVSGELQEQLAARDLDYDVLMKEALRRRGKSGNDDALRALSSLVENSPGDTILTRDIAFTAMEWGLGGQSYHLFRRVAAVRPFEPQTYYGMALCLAEQGKSDLALAYYEVALAGRWDARFGEFHRIVMFDYLRFLRQLQAGPSSPVSVPEFAKARLETLTAQIGMKQADLIVGITWNTDNTDIDLHVTDPNGEECYYGHRQTKIGGNITQDVTQGYGPEMFTLPNAIPGNYRIWAHFFSSDRNRASARTRVFATVYENWGTPQEKVTRMTVTLTNNNLDVPIADLRIAK